MRQPSMSTTFLRPGVDFEAKPRAEVRRNALDNMRLWSVARWLMTKQVVCFQRTTCVAI